MVAARPAAQTRRPDVPGGQRDRHERAGIAGGDQRAAEALGVTFHLSEVKGPVMDRLRPAIFFHHLNGKVFLSQHQAAEAVATENARCEAGVFVQSNGDEAALSQEQADQLSGRIRTARRSMLFPAPEMSLLITR
jgi:hypothetical protein